MAPLIVGSLALELTHQPIIEVTMPSLKSALKIGVVAIVALIVAKRLPVVRDLIA